MSTEQSEHNKKKTNEDAAVKPDSETLNTTDPQEHMEGPISSLMQKAEESFESEDSGEKDDKEKEK
ncbi:MAG: hypothetical protein ABIN89_29110 [Chitinophagaceae bacterium]